ncbi:MAG: Gfo/Idh/MocA family oxidoreductase [Proteobacteria bacterium]|nr:Gfo/Idh/MocA family oxidoreductase [Pseudomonadota bacterium]
MIRFGVIGYGYWGPNIVRNFEACDGSKVTMICDGRTVALKRAEKTYPQIQTVSDCSEILNSPDIDAVAIVTPVSTHYELAKKALLNGKHVFVEKPFTATVAQAEELIDLAEKKNLKIMVDHTFLFTGAVMKIKELLDDQTLGDVYYYDSTRVNLGLFQHDVNVIWDLAPHDFSIMDYVLRESPEAVAATGQSHVSKFENVAYVTVYLSNNTIAHFNVNWLSPVKVRSTLIGGEKKMLVWNDVDVDEKIKIYDKGIDVKNREGIYDLLVSYRSGDIWTPRVNPTEALKLEAEYFLDCIENNKSPHNDGHAGLRVVKLLEACDKSLKKQGQMVKV